MLNMTTMAFWIYARVKRPQVWHVGQSVTTFGTLNLVPQAHAYDMATRLPFQKYQNI